MGWPIQNPTLANSQVGTNGILPTTIGWGTDGIYGGVIVKSARSVPMVEEVQIQNGSGITSRHVILLDGDFMEITVEDDRNVSFPVTGQSLILYNPQPNGTSVGSELFQILNNNYNASRKQNGERTIIGKRYALFAPVSQM